MTPIDERIGTMAHLTFYGKLKSLALLATLGVVLLLGALLYFQNQKGFSGRWSHYIEAFFERYEIYCEVERYRYSLSEGVILEGLIFYAPEDRSKRLAQIDRVALTLDRTRLSRGQVVPQELTLSGGSAWIDLGDAEETRFPLTELSAVLDFTQGDDVRIVSATGRGKGIPFEVTGRCLDLLKKRERRTRELSIIIPEPLRLILRQMDQLSFAASSPPQLTIDFTLDLESEEGLTVEVHFESEEIAHPVLELLETKAHLTYSKKVITLHQFEGQDDTGPLTLSGSFSLATNEGDFSVNSRANFTKILRRFSVDSVASQLVSPLPPRIQAKGRLHRLPGAGERPDQWEVSLFGEAEIDEFRLLGHSFQSLKSEFSWKEGALFLRDLEVQHAQGGLKGTIMLDAQSIRYEAFSTLPVQLFQPFIKKGGILDRNINKTQFGEEGEISLSLKGTIDRQKIEEWSASGDLLLSNVSYNGVPLRRGVSTFSLTPLEARFNNIEATFGYEDYIPSQYARKQPSSGKIKVRAINFDSSSKTVKIEALTGEAWPAPVVNLFAPTVGAFIDKTVYLTQPPSFTVNGTVDTKKTARQTDLTIRLDRPSSLYYTFLNRDLLFEDLTTEIHLLKHAVHLHTLQTRTLGGGVKGEIEIINKNPQNPRGAYGGEFAFTDLSLIEIATKYEFETKTPGNLTGRLAFNGVPEDITSLRGEGFVALNRANLFYVPIFGPLSPLVSGLLGHRKTSHEKVNNLSCGFLIEDGIIYTGDLYSTTPSAKITGKGSINLETKLMDITVQASTQGLLGLITLPLKPFEKLLQFRGTGLVSEPQWASSPFEESKTTLPSKERPRKAIIVE